MGLIYQFKSNEYQKKEYLNDTLYYVLGVPMIERILDKEATVSTSMAEMIRADEDFRTAFETSDRLLRKASFKLRTRVMSLIIPLSPILRQRIMRRRSSNCRYQTSG